MKHQTIDRHLEKLLSAKLDRLRTEVHSKEYWTRLSDKEAVQKIALFAMGISGY